MKFYPYKGGGGERIQSVSHAEGGHNMFWGSLAQEL